MATRTDLTKTIRVGEGTSAQLLFKPGGIGTEEVEAEDLDTLTLTLYEETSREIINSKSAADILSDFVASVDGEGLGIVELEADDNAILSARTIENHVALIRWTWNSGAKFGAHEIVFPVYNFAKVT